MQSGAFQLQQSKWLIVSAFLSLVFEGLILKLLKIKLSLWVGVVFLPKP
jgi:hypothetical protein